MSKIDDLRSLYRHMSWADAAVWRSVLELPPAAGDGRLRELLHHIHSAQHAFLRIWSERPLTDLPEAASFADLESICRWGREGHENVQAYLEKIDGSDLDRAIDLPWSDRIGERLGVAPKPVTAAQTMLQVTYHSTYHRGQVNARLRQLGGEPPMVDFIAWVLIGEPAAAWPES